MATANDKNTGDARWQAQGPKLLEPIGTKFCEENEALLVVQSINESLFSDYKLKVAILFFVSMKHEIQH